MPFIDINSAALVKHTARLERLHRSALPVAVRNTLSRAAFDVKKETMPASAKKAFIQRRPSFFKANSKVIPAKGFDISSMQATVGFVAKNGRDQAVDDLEKQEEGGGIGGRSFISMKTARASNSWRKSVKVENRLTTIGNRIIDARKVKSANKKQRYIRAAYMAAKLYGSDGFVLGNKRAGGARTLSRINEIWGSTRGRGGFGSRSLMIVRTPIYTYKKGRNVVVKKTDFMKRASMESGLRMSKFFIEEANKQIQKLK